MIRIATVGTSVITDHFAQAAQASGRLDCVAAYSRDPARAQTFAARIGAPYGVSDLPALLASQGADRIDALYVASPNAIHPEQIRMALEAGKHVLAEKPLAPTAAQAQELFALADARGLVLLEAMRSVFDPGMGAVRELMGTLGPLRRASLRYVQRSARYDQVLAGEQVAVFDPAFAGGSLYDLGVYTLHPMVHLFGVPDSIMGYSVPVASGADGAGAALAAYPGLVVDLSYSKITASTLPSEIQGETGTLIIDHIAMPRHLRVEPLGGEPVDYDIEGAANNLIYEIDRFADLVAGGQLGEVERERSLAVAHLVDQLRGS